MVGIEEALRYPMERENWYTTIVIGGILSLFSFLIIPLFLVYGYLLQVIQRRLAGQFEPPVFEEWGQLLVDGVKVWIIGLIYLLIPILIAVFTVGSALVGFVTGTEVGAAIGLAGMVVGLFVSFVLFLVFGYIAAAAIVNFAHEQEFGAAFDFASLKPILLHGDYVVGWLMAVGVLIGGGILGGFLNAVPVLGAILAAFLLFYLQVVAVGMIADGFAAAAESLALGDQAVTDEAPA